MINACHAPVRCGIVLAGGEGKRLQAFVYRLRGDNLPKQYVTFTGRGSMLEHAYRRAERLVPPERLFTVVSQDHLKYPEARKQLFDRPIHTLVLQPMNRETGPGVLLPLMHVARRYPRSTVAVFPSDHFILEEDRFMAHVELAFRVVEQNPSRIVLLGIKPNQAEPDYGYILPNGKLNGLSSLELRGVESFIEKPDPETARELVSRGGLWNTMVMVFSVKIFLSLVSALAPALYRPFQSIHGVIGSSGESLVTEYCYQHMEAANFSKDLLEAIAAEQPQRLTVIPVEGVLWSDWGSAPHILSTLQKIGGSDRIPAISEATNYETAS